MAESALARMPMAARVGVSVGLAVLAGIAYYVLFYSEVAGKIDATIAERAGLESELQRAKVAEQAYQKDLEELARRRERERELNKILPPDAEYPAFLAAIQGLATTTGLELLSWSPQPEDVRQYYARVPMKVEVRGRFHQIAKFFYGIGQNDRIMNMENISLTNPEVRDRDMVLRVSGMVTAFRALSATDAKPSEKRKRGGK